MTLLAALLSLCTNNLKGLGATLTTQLRNWVKQLADDPQHAFPGHGQMKPEQLEIAQLKREVAKLKAERDILKKAAAYFAKEST
jgi:transposase